MNRERIGALNPRSFLSPPHLTRDAALFLDVDGTLLEFAHRPDAVVPSAELPDLSRALGGALALISGRTVDDLDRIFTPLRLPAGGQHGLERRDASGRLHRADLAHALDDIRLPLQGFADANDGVLLEDKGAALTLYYRIAPDAEADARALVDRLTAERDELHYLAGKMVFEIKSRAVDKGVAIACFMDETPFAGWVPTFVGDDVTDEDGFRFVNQTGGMSVRVGKAAESAARYGLNDVGSVLQWLRAAADQFDEAER